MDLDLRKMRYFLAVAEQGTYAAAAQALHIATPSLSQQVRKLESELGVRLFDRDHRGARLTTVGEDLLVHVRELMATQERVVALVRQHARSARGTLRLGFVAGAAGPPTKRMLDRLRAQAPEADVELVQVGWAEQLSAVLEGRVDAVFARPPLPPAPVRRTVVLTEPRVLAMSADHPLAAREQLRIADLTDVVQVTSEHVDETWLAWWSIDPRPDGSRPRYGPVVHTMEELLQVVASSDVVAITAAGVADTNSRPDVAYRTITDAEPTTVELVTALDAVNPLVRALLRSVGPPETST